MDTVVSKLTILFQNPFWVGIYERESNGQYEVCKITFGAEPKDYEVYDLLQNNRSKLRFSPVQRTVTGVFTNCPARETDSLSRTKQWTVAVGSTCTMVEKHVNPKRMQRLIHKQTQHIGIGTKAQQALKLQQEQEKSARKVRTREQREAEKNRQFLLKQEKRKEKKKGH